MTEYTSNFGDWHRMDLASEIQLDFEMNFDLEVVSPKGGEFLYWFTMKVTNLLKVGINLQFYFHNFINKH